MANDIDPPFFTVYLPSKKSTSGDPGFCEYEHNYWEEKAEACCWKLAGYT